jgi:3-hydroxyacyl-CoA dehydrogenase
MRAEGMTIPLAVDEVLKNKTKSFYTRDDQARAYHFYRGAFNPVEYARGTIDLAALKAQGRVVKKNAGARPG